MENKKQTKEQNKEQKIRLMDNKYNILYRTCIFLLEILETD